MSTIISEGITREDKPRIAEILRSTNFFYEFEIDTAMEIVDVTIRDGSEKSGYYWLKAIDDDGIVAFANYGKNDFSVHSWELFWIAVHGSARHKKLGTALLKVIEEKVVKKGGKILWIETSGRPLYSSTESFYTHNGYALAASLKDFYGPDDPKQIYYKVLH
jgi:GNAT superfamily N-acetyltransferase